MKLSDILSLDCVLCHTPSNNKKRLLEKICQLAITKVIDIDEDELLDSLLDREKMGSTGIGNGIAIPHGRIPNSNKAVAVIITTEQAIDFDAIDNRHVDVFISLFVPKDSCQTHLDTLQNIAKLFSDKKIVKQVRKCRAQQDLYTIIQQNS